MARNRLHQQANRPASSQSANNSGTAPPGRGDPHPPQGTQTNTSKPHWTQHGMFWATVAAFLGVCAYTYYARLQVSRSETANKIAQMALAEANKPYVLVSGFAPSRIVDRKNNLHERISILWTNYGNTPADNVRATICEPIIRHDLVMPVFTCKVTEALHPSIVVGPKQQTIIFGPQIDDDDLLATADGSTAIYVLGKIEYTDGVDLDQNGNPLPRMTWFCDRIVSRQLNNPTTPRDMVPIPQQATPIISAPCPTINCADAACSAQNVPTIPP
jgi:hypothetical protein